MPPRKRLGQLLTELGVVDEHQLQSALGHQKQWGGKLGGILVQKGFCKEDEVVSALSKHLGMPAVKLSQAKVDDRAVKFVSKQIAEKLHVFPYEVSGSGRGESVTIAMSDPTDLSAVDQLAFHTGKRIKPMLAGDSEIISAIQQHYGSAEEKKEPTDKLAKPAATPGPAAPAVAGAPKAAAPTPPAAPPVGAAQFPRRIDPQQAATPAGGTPRVAPYVPPPIPAAPAKPAQKLEEIEPDEAMAAPVPTPPPPKPEPLELPESEDDGSGQMMGLEPIAAHTQVEDVAGHEEVAGEGSAADAVEGLESASVAHEGAAEAQAQKMEGLEPIAAHSQEQGWGTQPAPSAEGWETQPAAPAWEDAAAAADTSGWADAEPAKAPEPSGWSDQETQAEPPAEPAQDWSASESWGAGEQAAEPASEQLPADAIIGTAEAAPAWGGEDQDAAALAEQAIAAEQETAAAAAQTIAAEQEAAAGQEAAAPAAPAPEAEAPDAWASSEDPLAAQGAANEASTWGDAAQSAEASWSEAPSEASAAEEPPAAAETAVESAAAAETEAPPEWGAESEAPAVEEEAAPAEPPSEETPAEFSEDQGELKLEGWVAPPPEPEPEGAGWMGAALEATAPLSPADLGTLASVGVDPNDGVAALRLLASLVRILNRRQSLDLDEVAAEIRESRAQGAAAAAEAQAQADENGAPEASVAEHSETAET